MDGIKGSDKCMKLDMTNYQEVKPFRMKRIVWRLVNSTIYRACTSRFRIRLLKWFGATVRWGAYHGSANIFAPWNLECPAGVCIGPGVEIYNKSHVYIGDAVTISQGAYICTASHDVSSPKMALLTKPIVINSQAWIAARAIVLPGVTIGEGAVVGAGAVVAKDVPPWVIVAGNPARIVGRREIKYA